MQLSWFTVDITAVARWDFPQLNHVVGMEIMSLLFNMGNSLSWSTLAANEKHKGMSTVFLSIFVLIIYFYLPCYITITTFNKRIMFS